jgi:hypothetical protein
LTDLREQDALRDQCTVFLTGHGPVRPADLLASIPADTMPDRYGDPPQVSMMHLLLAVTQEGFAAAARRLAAEQGVWAWPQAMITSDPGVQRVELYVGDATRAIPPTGSATSSRR